MLRVRREMKEIERAARAAFKTDVETGDGVSPINVRVCVRIKYKRVGSLHLRFICSRCEWNRSPADVTRCLQRGFQARLCMPRAETPAPTGGLLHHQEAFQEVGVVQRDTLVRRHPRLRDRAGRRRRRPTELFCNTTQPRSPPGEVLRPPHRDWERQARHVCNGRQLSTDVVQGQRRTGRWPRSWPRRAL